jgi:hypothetical protein
MYQGDSFDVFLLACTLVSMIHVLYAVSLLPPLPPRSHSASRHEARNVPQMAHARRGIGSNNFD